MTADAFRYYYILCVEPSKAAFLLIFVEMSIYITYYKDVMFSLLTLVNFVGMLIVSQEQLSAEQQQLGTISLQEKIRQITNWLIAMVVLNVIWLVVTVIADFDSAFYRKAFVYKRRVDRALLKQREQLVVQEDEDLTQAIGRTTSLLFKSIVEPSRLEALAEEKVRSNSFNQFMMYENL